MAKRPEVVKSVLNRQDLLDLQRRLSSMSVTAVRDFYAAAHWACKLDGQSVPTARHVQELVAAWKQMRNWGRSGAKDR